MPLYVPTSLRPYVLTSLRPASPRRYVSSTHPLASSPLWSDDMSRFAWSEQVTTISSTLRTLEQQVADGQRDAPGLEDLKSALDDLRLRAWGLLMATNETDYASFQERFRIRRTKE